MNSCSLFPPKNELLFLCCIVVWLPEWNVNHVKVAYHSTEERRNNQHFALTFSLPECFDSALSFSPSHFLDIFLYLQTAAVVLWDVYYYFAAYFHKMVVMNANFRESAYLFPVFVIAFSFKEKTLTNQPSKPKPFLPWFPKERTFK